MESWLKNEKTKFLICIICALVGTIIVNYPYLFSSFLGIEHDTFFHLSRIEGMAESLSRGDLFPSLYPFKNNGFGYASPSFYCDILLIPAAVLYLCGLPLTFCYKQYVFVMTFLSALTMMHAAWTISHNHKAAILSSLAYLFSLYHLTDIYIRSALGEVTAMAFLPLIVSGMYLIFDQKETQRWPILACGLTLTALSHNLSFLLAVILCIIFFFVSFRNINQDTLWALIKAVLCAFLLSAFYTIPMLEQLLSQRFYVSSSASSGNLSYHVMRLFQFFENRLVFGYSGMNYDADHAMTLSIAWFLMFAPLLWFVLKKDIRKQYHFVSVCLFTGYVFMILPAEFVPWNILSFFSVLQFPWRLEMIAMMLLSIPAGLAFAKLAYSRYTVPLLCGILAVQCIIQLQPACERTFGITSETAYEDITEGRIVDPYYSATYMRVELAGGDYIPIGSPDFRDYGTMIRKIDGTPAEIPYEKNGNTLSFHLYTERPEMLMMPLTWYLGYQVYYEDGGSWRRIESYPSPNRMVTFLSEGEGNYRVVFEKTIIKKITVVISCVTLLILCVMHFLRKRRNNVPDSL